MPILCRSFDGWHGLWWYFVLLQLKLQSNFTFTISKCHSWYNRAVWKRFRCLWPPQGYRCFKMVMFFSGFILGSAATLLLYHKEPMLDAQLALESKAGIGLAVGVLTGLMTMLVPTMGLLFSGLQLGGLLAVAALVVVGQFHSLSSLWVPLGGTLAASVVSAVVTLLWQKLFAIIYTSALGAGAVTLCADHLMGASALPDQVYDMLHQGAPRRLCWFNWAIASIFPALSLMGVLVQWHLTTKGLSHRAGGPRESLHQLMHSVSVSECCHCQYQPTHPTSQTIFFFPRLSCCAVPQQKHKKCVKKHKYRESRRRAHSQRRRKPPPLRRYNGDVLAPVSTQVLILSINRF